MSANNNSSSIFTIAENLREMQIEAAVGELDVTSIHKGQEVRFTLESLRGRRFSGVVENIRMIPVISNSVVSYTVIINVENRDGSLLPGMTCAVDFIVERSENILTVSNAALRYQPTNLTQDQINDLVFNASLANMNDEQKQAAIEARAQANAQSTQGGNNSQGLNQLIMGPQPTQRMPGSAPRPAGGGRGESGQGRGARAVVMRNLWFFTDDGKLDCIQVRTGITDGSSTEIFVSDELENKQVILREKL